MVRNSTPALSGTLELRDRLASGAMSALELVDLCIERIAARDGLIEAWAWFDPEFARAQARQLDIFRKTGRPIGPLHGLPVGIKDIIDTAKIPTENGCKLDSGRVPLSDAWVIERLRQAGAIIMGKTAPTELAYMHAAKTRNPHNPDHTPGGSSSGSAAAVADGMVPLAVGTQTGGSMIRPASYCGVTGFKPSFGAIPRRGILMQSHNLDTIGVFAGDPLGAALISDVLFGYDQQDSMTRPTPAPHLCKIASSHPPLPPVFAFVRPPGWENADKEMQDGMAELVDALGDQAYEVELPKLFEQAAEQRKIINFAEMSRHYFKYYRDGSDRLGEETLAAIEEGNTIPARDYIGALEWRAILNSALEEIFERSDAILCPAATGPAPEGLQFTGDAIFNGLWTLCGTPAVTVPLLTASNGLPMGVQLVGSVGNDARLLRTAHWLSEWVDE